jgi:hypothetical protein
LKVARPAKGRSTSRWKSRTGKPPEEPGSQSPAFIEKWASKREEANPQAATSRERCRVEKVTREGMSEPSLALLGEGRSPGFGFWSIPESLRRRGDSMRGRLIGQLGRPSRTRRRVDRRGSSSRYKAIPKAGAVRRESERVIVPMIVGTAEPGVGKDPHFGDAHPVRGG